MDSSGTHRVEGDPGNRPDSPASVVGGQASHAPPTNEPEQVVGGTMGILQQLAQALQRAGQPAAIAPQRSAIERMARYRPVDFMGKKDDEPAMAENWLEKTERMLVQMHCTAEENWNVRPHYCRMRLISGGFPIPGPLHQRELHGGSSWMSSRSIMWAASI